VLIEGTSYKDQCRFDVNADLARTLAAPVLVVVSGKDRSANDIYDNTILSRERFAQRGCDVLAVIVNRARAEGFNELVATLQDFRAPRSRSPARAGEIGRPHGRDRDRARRKGAVQ
jgi:phosphate acetyltransferase